MPKNGRWKNAFLRGIIRNILRKGIRIFVSALCRPFFGRGFDTRNFLQAYTAIHRFRGECEVSTWLISIGKYVYLRYLKKNKLHLHTANLDLVANTYGIETDDPRNIIYKIIYYKSS